MPKKAESTPSDAEAEGKRYPLNMRTTLAIRRQLEAAAAASGRSLTQEAELRIDRSFHDQNVMFDGLEFAYGKDLAAILVAIGETMRSVGISAALSALGRREGAAAWWAEPYSFDQAAKAAVRIIEDWRPAGDAKLPAWARGKVRASYENLGESVARSFLNDITHEPPAADERRARLRKLFSPELVAHLKKKLRSKP